MVFPCSQFHGSQGRAWFSFLRPPQPASLPLALSWHHKIIHLTCSQPLCLTTVMRTQPLRATITPPLAFVAPPTPNSGRSHCDHRFGHKTETGICCFCRCSVAPALTSLWAPDPPSPLLQPSPCECISPALATSPRPEPEPELE